MSYEAPLTIPDPSEETFKQFLLEELTKISERDRQINTAIVSFQVLYTEPEKPRIGMVAYADGTSWAPGVGAGLHYYNGSTWIKVGL